MIVTADKYELPILVANNAEELAEYVGRPVGSIYCSLTRGCVDKILKVKYVRVEYD